MVWTWNSIHNWNVNCWVNLSLNLQIFFLNNQMNLQYMFKDIILDGEVSMKDVYPIIKK